MRRQAALTVLVLGAASLVFSWPLALHPGQAVLTRQFDVWSLLWMLGEAPRLGLDVVSERSAWPLGQSLLRADSLLVLPLGALLTPWLGADRVVALLVLAGPVLSGWAAERFAVHALGARWPWSLVAGLAYAFSGLAATAVLEGHVYFLLAPWLPLLGIYGLRALGPEGRWWHGALAGACWGLCLLSTAYFGVVATLLVLFGLVGGRARLSWRPALGAAAVALPVGLAYTASFVRGAAEARAVSLPDENAHVLQAGAATLASLGGWTPSIDAVYHSIAPWLPHVALVLALVAPVVLPRRRHPLRWLLASLALVAASLGPTVDVAGLPSRLPWVFWPLAQARFDVLFHFPARLLWLAVLLLGALGAAVATRLAERPRLRWGAAGLLVFAWLDAALLPALPTRGAVVPLATPSAYAAAPADLAVLELAPSFLGPNWDLELYTNNLTCAYQRVHGRPLLNRCIGTSLAAAPRARISRWLFARLLPEGDLPQDTSRALAQLGVGAVAFHADWFAEPDRSRLALRLRETFGEPAAASDDAGDRVEIYAIPGGRPGDGAGRRAAYALLVGEAG